MAVKKTFVVKNNYKLVPPDGGYGYVILCAVSVNLMATTMFAVCFGMIFNDFFIQTGMGTTYISLLTGINAVCIAVSGFLSGPLLKTMSRRKLALIGSTFFNAGLFGTVFVKSQAQLIICQGLLQSFGAGFVFNVSFTMLNDYFVEKRLFSMSVPQTLSAAAAMVAPIIVSWAQSEYGFRGTLLVPSAFGLQTFVASLALQPVAWHMKKVSVDTPEKTLLLAMDKSVDCNDKVLQTPVINLTEIEKADLMYEEKELTKPSNCTAVITWIKEFLDWPLFKKFALTCGCLGPPTAAFADATFVFFLAQALYDWKWTKDQVKWALALISFGDIAGRIILIFSSAWLKKIGSHQLYVIGLLIAIVTKLGMLWVRDYMMTLAIITLMGLSRCTIAVLFSLVVSDSVKPEEFPSAMGIAMMMFGIFSIIMGPVAGAIRDATGNYTTMFLGLTGVLVAITILWIIELMRARHRITSTKEIK